MTRTLMTVLAATALVAVACVQGPPVVADPGSARLEALAAALTIRDHEPAAAATLLEAAGPGAALEALRQELWVTALEQTEAEPDRWQRLAEVPPAASVAARVRVGTAAALFDDGRVDEALSLLSSSSSQERNTADLLRLRLGGDTADSAARRLAVFDPATLERENRGLARAAAEALGAEERLQRARRWRELGAPSRAVAELRSGRWPDDLEEARRLELARAELERGSPSRALSAVPSRPDLAPEARVVRAAAFRAQGWSRFPEESAGRAFRDCAETLRPLAGQPPAATEAWGEAQRLLLECSTEIGDLTVAVTAWQSLERTGWTDSRRGWLGRRLGVALARAGHPEARRLAAALPDHQRCLAYWLARSESDADAGGLSELAEAPVSDLYGGWARRRLATDPVDPPSFAAELPAAPAPSTVAWLLERGEPGLALAEWRRAHASRGIRPAEALAAAGLAARLGRRNEVISWLRVGFPEVAGPDLGTVPVNVARAYLPLDWEAELVAAARSQGLSPWLVAAVARQESTFNPRARSPAGAVGLLQLMPSTARGHARALGLGRAPDLTEPTVNLQLGSRELASLITRFGQVEPALAAYNAGETRARRWWRRWPDRELFVEAIPIPETYTYVRRVVFLAEAYRVTYPELGGEGS